MEKNYIAEFEVQALLHVAVTVTGTSQEDGIANAYDAVQVVTPDMVTNITLVPDSCRSLYFQLRDEAQLKPAISPPVVSPQGLYAAKFFSGKSGTGELLHQIYFTDYPLAKDVLEREVSGKGLYAGSATLMDAAGNQLYVFNDTRGGWEILPIGMAGLPVNTPTESWLESRVVAVELALKGIDDGKWSSCAIRDFTDRKAGSVLWKVLT